MLWGGRDIVNLTGIIHHQIMNGLSSYLRQTQVSIQNIRLFHHHFIQKSDGCISSSGTMVIPTNMVQCPQRSSFQDAHSAELGSGSPHVQARAKDSESPQRRT